MNHEIIESHSRRDSRANAAQLSAGYQNTTIQTLWSNSQQQVVQSTVQQPPTMQHQQGSTSIGNHEPKYPSSEMFTRERSSSNRNLQDTSKLRGRPRRASDEVATSSSQRPASRLSPASSRRSKSVMNVGDGFGRPGSRLGSQSNILKIRRDSNQQPSTTSGQVLNRTSQTQQPGTTGSPLSSKYNPSPSGSTSQIVGVTPAGRRSSLIGIQSMSGYRSQKNSQSDTTDPSQSESPLRSSSLAQHQQANKAQTTRSQVSAVQQSSLLHSASSSGDSGGGPTKHQGHRVSSQHRASIVSATNNASQSQATNPFAQQVPQPLQQQQPPSGQSSRRGSSAGGDHPTQLQRKGSFAMLTLRKLKRTMSLTKSGNDQDQTGSNQGSRRTSSSSNNSASDLDEDLGVTRRIAAHKGECLLKCSG